MIFFGNATRVIAQPELKTHILSGIGFQHVIQTVVAAQQQAAPSTSATCCRHLSRSQPPTSPLPLCDATRGPCCRRHVPARFRFPYCHNPHIPHRLPMPASPLSNPTPSPVHHLQLSARTPSRHRRPADSTVIADLALGQKTHGMHTVGGIECHQMHTARSSGKHSTPRKVPARISSGHLNYGTYRPVGDAGATA